MAKNITVAVDGPAGSGKSSVCKAVAKDLSLKYIDSGAIYRTITLYCINKKMLAHIEEFSSCAFTEIDIRQDFLSDGRCVTFLNGTDVSDAIRDETIVKYIGKVSDSVVVREFVNTLLRKWAAEESVIMDGRDIGTVVFPNADIKIYLDASVDVRAQRRVNEYIKQKKNVDKKDVKNQIMQRDEQDINRKYGALKMAEDAIYCDTSLMSQSQVVDYLKQLIKKNKV